MNEVQPLIQTLDRLLAPDGCPWDREQTLLSMRSSLIEEAYELVEAIDLNDNHKIEEELGDFLCLALFLSRLAEKEKRFNLKEVVNHVTTKLIRRHPHIFGEASISSSDEVLKQWEEIKKEEKKGKGHSPSLLEEIPKNLPSLAKAQKIVKKLKGSPFLDQMSSKGNDREEKAGAKLWEIVQEMALEGIQPEQALSKHLSKIDQDYRNWEDKSKNSIVEKN